MKVFNKKHLFGILPDFAKDWVVNLSKIFYPTDKDRLEKIFNDILVEK